MHATLAILLVITAYPRIASQNHFDDYMNVVVDILDKQNLPSRVIAYVCWPTGISLIRKDIKLVSF